MYKNCAKLFDFMFYGIRLSKPANFFAENLRICDIYCTFVQIFSTLGSLLFFINK